MKTPRTQPLRAERSWRLVSERRTDHTRARQAGERYGTRVNLLALRIRLDTHSGIRLDVFPNNGICVFSTRYYVNLVLSFVKGRERACYNTVTQLLQSGHFP